jgi:hypothetical protein
MTNRQRIKIGDVFRVSIDVSTERYFQFVAIDTTQLDSDVIRVFQGIHRSTEPKEIEQIVSGPTEFYAHVFLKIGLKQNIWQKVGHSRETGRTNVLFRNSNDYGNPRIKTSRNWHVWNVNAPFQWVGKLKEDYQNAEIGVVVPPDSLVHRMRTGVYDFVYPDF